MRINSIIEHTDVSKFYVVVLVCCSAQFKNIRIIIS